MTSYYYYFKKINPVILFLLLGLIALLSCKNNSPKVQDKPDNDLEKFGLKGPVSSIKVIYYGGKTNELGEFEKNDRPTLNPFSLNDPTGQFDLNNVNPNWIENDTKPLPSTITIFNLKGYVWKEFGLSDKGIKSFTQNHYNNQTKLTKSCSVIAHNFGTIDTKKLMSLKDKNDEVWPSNYNSLDSIIYVDSTVIKYTKEESGNFYLSKKTIYNKQNKIIEEKEFWDKINARTRTLYEYDDKGNLISETKWGTNSSTIKTLYEYYPNRKISKSWVLENPVYDPYVMTEYFDSTGKNIIKRSDSKGELVTFEYDKFGNTTTICKKMSISNINLDVYKSKYVYKDFDQFGNWTKREAFVFNNFNSQYEQVNVIEREIKFFKEILPNNEKESLQNIVWLPIVLFYFHFFILPILLSGLGLAISSIFVNKKTMTELTLFYSTLLISVPIYIVVASIGYLNIIQYEFEKFSKYWWFSNLLPIAFFFGGYIFLKSCSSDIRKEMNKTKEHHYSTSRIKFNYFIDYSRVIIGKISFIPLLIYLTMRIIHISTNNSFFEKINSFILMYF